MSAAPSFHYEVISKVETLFQDGQSKYVLHGKLGLETSDGDGQMVALTMPEDLWAVIDPGDVLEWTMAPLEKF